MRDGDIREVLLAHLRATFEGDRIRGEMGLCLGETRADVVVINGNLHGYEIKSERDTLSRLRKQINLYEKVLDFSTIVTSGRHIARIEVQLPPTWGLMKAERSERGICLKHLRAAHRNHNVDPFSVAQLLWRNEAAVILESRGERVASRETRWNLWDRLAVIPIEDLQDLVRTQIKARQLWPGG